VYVQLWHRLLVLLPHRLVQFRNLPGDDFPLQLDLLKARPQLCEFLFPVPRRCGLWRGQSRLPGRCQVHAALGTLSGMIALHLRVHWARVRARPFGLLHG